MILINFSIMATMLTSKSSARGAILWFICPLLQYGQTSPLYLHCPEDFLSPEQIESHLPEENIYGILGHPGKTGAEGIVVQMA